MNWMTKAVDSIKGYKEIEVFKTVAYPLLLDIDGLRETAMNIDEAIKRTFLGHAKLALVGCGTSGVTLMTAVSVISGIDCCIISKDGERHHRPEISISLYNHQHLIVVDDRIESGDTMKRISYLMSTYGEGYYNYRNKVKMVCAKYANEKREQLKELFPNCKYFCY